jgi:ADP-ribosylglycohydrolase
MTDELTQCIETGKITQEIADKLAADAMATLGTKVHPAFGLPYSRWARDEEEGQVVGARFSPACYIEDAFPASLFLVSKYGQDARGALISNSMLGGDNCHRGVVVGALCGALAGEEGLPPGWITQLKDYPRLSSLLADFPR